MTNIARRKESGQKTAMYGYKIGQVVENIMELHDESGIRVDFGTKLRLVAFAPKVFTPRINEGPWNDGKTHFFNAVRADQADFWEHYYGEQKDKPRGKRIRANFCTIRKVKS